MLTEWLFSTTTDGALSISAPNADYGVYGTGASYGVTGSGPGGVLGLGTRSTSTHSQVRARRQGRPCGRPGTANINFVPNVDLSNAFSVGLSGSGTISVAASASTHVVIDIGGYVL